MPENMYLSWKYSVKEAPGIVGLNFVWFHTRDAGTKSQGSQQLVTVVQTWNLGADMFCML